MIGFDGGLLQQKNAFGKQYFLYSRGQRESWGLAFKFYFFHPIGGLENDSANYNNHRRLIGRQLMKNWCGKLFNTKKRPTTHFIFMPMLMVFLVIGCSDSALESFSDENTFEAQMEEAQIALDDADYIGAVEILESMAVDYPDNQTVKQYLSNAYAGLGGLDTYDFLATIDELNDKGRSGSIDMVGSVLGDSNGTLSETQIVDKLSNMDRAIEIMGELIDGQGSATVQALQFPDGDRIVQRGLLGISRIVLLMADMIIDQLRVEEVVMTEDGLQGMYANNTPDFEGIYDSIISDKLAGDIAGIALAVAAIYEIYGIDNDLYDDFKLFLDDLDKDGNRRVSQEELESYLHEVIDA